MSNIFLEPLSLFGKIFDIEDFSTEQSKLLLNISQSEAFLMKAKSRSQTDEFEAFHNKALLNFDDIRQICDQIDSEAEKLSQHLQGNFEPRITFYYISSSHLKYDIYWRHHTGPVLWSTGDIHSDHLLAIILCQLNYFASVTIKKYEKTEFKAGPLFKYHPERFFQTRKYFNECKNALLRGYDIGSGCFKSIEAVNRMATEIMHESNSKAMRHPLMGREKDSGGRFMIESEMNLGGKLLSFVASGKQILDISPELTFMFSKTDANDIPLSLIQLPYRSQYIYFGTQEDIELVNGWFFDGAYVDLMEIEEEKTLRVTITSRNKDDQQVFLWHSHAEPTYSQSIEKAHSNKDLSTAITEAYSDQLEQLRKNVSFMESANVLSQLSYEHGIQIVDVREKNNRIAIERSKNLYAGFEKAIGLIVNALCYLTAYPEDNAPEWPAGTPESLKNLSENGTSKERERAESKLSKLGYTKIRFYGKNLHRNLQHGDTTSNKESHWRRGHHKQQPYGPKSSLRKLIWIMPTLINKHLSEETKGHIYEIG